MIHARNAARRAVEDRNFDVSASQWDRFEEALHRDVTGADAAYLAAVSDRNYETGFYKLLAGTPGAGQMLSPAESESVERVGTAMAQRALGIGEGKIGGFALPIAIDPSVILTSEGAVSPLRSLATVTTISTSEWRGVSSAGTTAAFAKEGTEVGDNTPELSQPVIKPEKAHSFIPFSIEVGEDWTSLQSELARLFTDAKNVLEATKFLTGSGTEEPAGIITGATEVIKTTTEKKLESKDPYLLQNALAVRWQPGATWQTSLTVANALYKTVGGGSSEPPVFNEERDRLLMKPWHENSVMDTGYETQTKKIAIYGDVAAGFRIIDRVGMSVELAPMLFGKTNLRPTGSRGLYCFWRTGSKVVNKAALRVMEVK